MYYCDSEMITHLKYFTRGIRMSYVVVGNYNASDYMI